MSCNLIAQLVLKYLIDGNEGSDRTIVFYPHIVLDPFLNTGVHSPFFHSRSASRSRCTGWLMIVLFHWPSFRSFGGTRESHPDDFLGLIFSSTYFTSASLRLLNSKGFSPRFSRIIITLVWYVVVVLFCEINYIVSCYVPCSICEISGYHFGYF